MKDKKLREYLGVVKSDWKSSDLTYEDGVISEMKKDIYELHLKFNLLMAHLGLKFEDSIRISKREEGDS